MELEPGVEEVHSAKLSEGSQAEVEEVDDVDGQHGDEVKLRNKFIKRQYKCIVKFSHK